MIDHILFPDILYPILDRLNHVYKLVIRKLFELGLLDQLWYSFVSFILFSFIFNSLKFCFLIFDRCLNPFLRKFSYIETIGRSAIEERIISLENLCSFSHKVTFWVFGLFLEGCMNELIWWTAYRPSHIVTSAVESWSHIDLIDLSNFHNIVRLIYGNLFVPIRLSFLNWKKFINLNGLSSEVLVILLCVWIHLMSATLICFISVYIWVFCLWKVVVKNLVTCSRLNGFIIDELWFLIMKRCLSPVSSFFKRNRYQPYILWALLCLLLRLLDRISTLFWSLSQTLTWHSVWPI